MKKIARYVLTAAMMLASAIGAQAQSDPDATIKAITKVIWKHEQNAEQFIQKEIYPKFKKNPEVLTGIAKAYNAFKDTTIVLSYIDKALSVDAKHVPAYVLRGTMYKEWGFPERAIENYDLAIAANPKNPEGYLAYADMLSREDPEAAISKLSEILAHDPNYDVNLYAGHLYLDRADGPNAYKYFINADTSRMATKDFVAYVTVLRVQHDYNKADSVLQTANAKYPTHLALNRLRLANDISAKKYEHALTAADILFNKSDSLEVDLNDYINYGKAYVGLNRHKEGIDIFQKCIDYEILRKDYRSDERYENAKKQEGKLKGNAMQEIAKSYDKMGYPDEAIAMQKRYIDYKKELGTLDASDINDLALLYKSKQEMTMGEEKQETIRNWYETYSLMAEVAPEHATLAYYTRWEMAYNKIIDPEGKEELACQDAEKVVESVPVEGEVPTYNRNRQITSLRYLIDYYLNINTDYKKLRKYWTILGQVDSTNKTYTDIAGSKLILRKMGIR